MLKPLDEDGSGLFIILQNNSCDIMPLLPSQADGDAKYCIASMFFCWVLEEGKREYWGIPRQCIT